jgi:hypothetical protein
MHLTIEQILWALVVACHLVLLIVLLGRDRTARFPWFTAATALSVARLIADHLLNGKLTTISFYWQSYTSMTLDAILHILVLVEIARQVFSSGKAGIVLKARGWLGGAFVTVAIAIAAVWAWGPWPTMVAFRSQPAQIPILLMVLSGLKGQLFAALLTVQVGVLVLAFGRRFGAAWRSHAQQIMLGLSTNAMALLVVQGITESIQRTVHLKDRAEYERLVHLFARLDYARYALWILVLAWWMVWLWRDEPGAAVPNGTEAPAEPLFLEGEFGQADHTGLVVLPPVNSEDDEGDPDFRD